MNFKTIEDLYKAFPDENSCIEHLEKLRWNGLITSPFNHKSKVYICSNKRYRCKESGKYFNVKTKTLFDNSKISLQKWFVAIWLFQKSNHTISSVDLSEKIKVTQKSAWTMLQRIKNCYLK